MPWYRSLVDLGCSLEAKLSCNDFADLIRKMEGQLVDASTKWILVFLLLGFPLAGAVRQTNHDVGLDNSDWWSIDRNPDPYNNIKPETREFSKSNFQILGIDLYDTM